jgi:hypothetical protein
MPRGEKDHATNWLIQNHPGALLRLAGIAQFRSCKAAHTRLTLPQALPDGLMEVVLPDQRHLHVLLEMESYPSSETEEQVARDMDLAEMALGSLPDTVLIVLAQRGKTQQSSKRTQQSALGWATRRHRWRVVEVGKVAAAELLALEEVALVPLLPLTRSRESTETLLQQCKDRIEQQGQPRERGTLLTITAILATLRFGYAERWLALLGGKEVVSHSPLYQKWMDEKECADNQAAILSFLEARFGAAVPEELTAHVRSVTDLQKLREGIKQAGRCKSLKDFRNRFAKV